MLDTPLKLCRLSASTLQDVVRNIYIIDWILIAPLTTAHNYILGDDILASIKSAELHGDPIFPRI